MTTSDQPASPPEKPRLQCDRCKLESDWVEAFHKAEKSNGLWYRKIFVCPRCWRRRKEREARDAFWGFLGLGLLGAFLAMILPSDGRWYLFNSALFLVASCVCVVPHEAGHALAGWLLGLRVYGVTIGMGRTVRAFHFGRFRIDIKAIPMMGLAWFAFPHLRLARLKKMLVLLAGPMTNALLLLAGLYWIMECNSGYRLDKTVPTKPLPEIYFETYLGREPTPAVAFVLANALCVLGSLFPHRVMFDGMIVDSDGLGLFGSLFASAETVLQWRANYFFMEAVTCAAQRQYADAVQWCERGLNEHPGDAAIRELMGQVLLHSGEFAKARQIRHDLLRALDEQTAARLRIVDKIAIADLLIGTPELLAEADIFTAQCVRTAPWDGNYQTTRGSFLIASGQLNEGRAILEATLKEPPGSTDYACAHAFLAIADARQGRVEEANRHLAEVRKLCPSSSMIERIAQKVAEELIARPGVPEHEK